MEQVELAHPPIASYDEWLAERKALLTEEKSLTRQLDALNAERRRMPMVKVDKEYVFDGPGGKVRLLDLFNHQHQLIVYHFMFDPAWEKGCPGCTGFVNAIGDISMLHKYDTSMVIISRAPLARLEAYKSLNGWTIPWFSSYGNSFNYDFHVTMDSAVTPPEYNYRSESELKEKLGESYTLKGEQPGLSVFFRVDDIVYHSYSTFGRGVEKLTDATSLLDVTPYGRQEDWEDSPPGWPQRPTYG